MTKEELKQEAEEWLCNNLHSASEEDFIKAMVDIAEPREKRIAELEHQLTHRNCLDCSNHSSKLRMRTLELEKENAELKSGCGMCYRKDRENLTKAKEIIKDLMCFIGGAVALHDCKRHKDINVEKLKAEAEQFLREVEK